MYTLTLQGVVNDEVPTEGFTSPQELCNWVADGWDAEYPTVTTMEQAQEWITANGCKHTVVQM